MAKLFEIKNDKNLNIYIFSFLLSILAYGFALSNYTISIDNEIPILSDFGLDTGRWGQNLIRYHLFNGHLHYFTLLLGLFFFSLSAVRLANLFNFHSISAYTFCALFVTFPQIAYELVFRMMADIAGFGIFLSIISVELFIKGLEKTKFYEKIFFLSFGALISVFTLSMYQAFILVIPTISIILFFQNTFKNYFNLRAEFKTLLFYGIFVVVSTLLYYFSVKIICPPIQDSSYLSSFLAGDSNNQLYDSLIVWYDNLTGSFYYGERLFVIVFICSILLSLRFFIEMNVIAVIRSVSLLLLLFLPFVMSFGITNGYHPPRIYIVTNIIFAFVIVFTVDYFKINSYPITKVFLFLISIINIYYVTNLFSTSDKIFRNDRRIAEKIDNIIQEKYPEFYETDKYIYFYGFFPYEYHQKFRLENSEIFGGSTFNWGNSAENYRIINFFKESYISEYKIIESKEKFDLVKDSIAKMPIWPNPESIRMFNGIVVVKLGNEKGSKLKFE